MEIVAAAKAKMPGISPKEAIALMEKGALVVDVWDPPELQAGSKIKGA
jgi:hypothetical protein